MKYEEIAGKYIDVVYRASLNYCKNKEDAEDAVQNTFLKLLHSKIEFADDEHLRRWLIRVAINECKNMWKSFWRKNVTSIEELDYEPESFEPEEKELFQEVMNLPPKYSIVVHLYYYEGYTIKEISTLLNISESNVQTRLMRARNKLKQQLKEA